jgi:hypothetical protein
MEIAADFAGRTPELDEKLDSMELRQLKQRIALRAHYRSIRKKRADIYNAGYSLPVRILMPERYFLRRPSLKSTAILGVFPD